MTKLWGGRFAKETDKLMEEFNASIAFDRRLYREDIRGSAAHANMLARCGIITDGEAKSIAGGLETIKAEIERGDFVFSVKLEDIHMNIEQRLTELIGEAGARLHTARSRNDQVALDLHMYVKREIVEIARLILDAQKVLLALAAKHTETIMPGYTHLQRAQPVTFAHHLLAYLNMLARDMRRLQGVWEGADIMPLGAGALAGTTLPIDRQSVAEELNFAAVYGNSMDAVSDRDYILEFLAFASILMSHLSRLGEEIVLWSSAEFSYIELDDAYSTGSSMMPQKKNPDAAELARGKSGRVYGHLLALLTVLKGLPLTYNKDLQEDKEGLFDAADTVKLTLAVFQGMLKTMKVNKKAMRDAVCRDFSNATDLADYLVKKGLPFRRAHEIVGKCVACALQKGKSLQDIDLKTYQTFSPLFAGDLFDFIRPETCVRNRASYGGPSPARVREQIAAAQKRLYAQKKLIAKLGAKI
ncbi:MAG: argininosuccinate lyase [Acidaminococcales bacterium]|jgi:argininosuccinate lyase|nr:argininosuccinate lyase [Acidaminococcales bacterium]